MKKTALTLLLALTASFAAMAIDMTTMWERIVDDKRFDIGQIAPEKAQANGFESLTVALNSAPSSDDINYVKRLAATIEESQKITSVSQQGVDVSIYAAPLAADYSEYKLLLIIDKDDNADKSLIILYGTCSRAGIMNALQQLSIEDIIGG